MSALPAKNRFCENLASKLHRNKTQNAHSATARNRSVAVRQKFESLGRDQAVPLYIDVTPHVRWLMPKLSRQEFAQLQIARAGEIEPRRQLLVARHIQQRRSLKAL